MSRAAALPATAPVRGRAIALVALAALGTGLSFANRDVLAGWLAGAAFWAGLPFGALVFVMIMRLVPGAWTRELGPDMEAQLPLVLPVALAFVPVVLAAGTLYPWAGETQRTAFRAAYLSVPFFAARTVVWFALAGGLCWLLSGRRGGSPALPCLGLIAWALGGTMVSTDWLQSLDPELNSSGFGLYALASWTVVATAFGTIAACRAGPIDKPWIVGGLLLTALLLWAYLAFMPFVIIWSGNLPAGARWYVVRREGVWAVVLWAYVLLGGVPLSLLMLPPVLGSRPLLPWLAGAALAGKALEFAWLVLPGRGPLAGIAWAGSLLAVGGACRVVARTVPREDRR